MLSLTFCKKTIKTWQMLVKVYRGTHRVTHTCGENYQLCLKGDNRGDLTRRPLEKVGHLLHQYVILRPPEKPEELGEKREGQ